MKKTKPPTKLTLSRESLRHAVGGRDDKKSDYITCWSCECILSLLSLC